MKILSEIYFVRQDQRFNSKVDYSPIGGKND